MALCSHAGDEADASGRLASEPTAYHHVVVTVPSAQSTRRPVGAPHLRKRAEPAKFRSALAASGRLKHRLMQRCRRADTLGYWASLSIQAGPGCLRKGAPMEALRLDVRPMDAGWRVERLQP